MKYNNLGKTGRKISAVSLGAEHLVDMTQQQVSSVVHRGLDMGMNYMDVFMPQDEIRTQLGIALGNRRKDMMLAGHIGSVVQNGQSGRTRDVKESLEHFERLLKLVNTDYMDAAMLFFVDTMEDLDTVMAPGGQLDLARKLKEHGKALMIGMSSHVPAVARRAVEAGILDLLMFPVNPLHDLKGDVDIDEMFAPTGYEGTAGMHKSRAAMYDACAKQGVGVVSMKTYGAGWLLKDGNPLGVRLTPEQCVHYALTRPAVCSAVTGVKTPEEVDAACAYCDATADALDLAVLAGASHYQKQERCMYCNHCLPCPVQIDIAASMRALDSGEGLGELPVPPQECIECGVCHERCPFGINPPERFSALK